MNELFDQLTGRLGITDAQAKAGTGLFLRITREKLAPADFAKVAEQIPGIDGVLAEAPLLDSKPKGLLGGIAGVLGNEKLEVISRMTNGFSQLGMNTSTLKDFGRIVLQFVEDKAGDQVAEIRDKLSL
jgi:hypothetical protein